MIEQVKKINNIYDLLALCSSYILNEIDNSPYEFATFDDEDYEYVYDAIETYCHEIRDKGSKAAFETLRNFIEDFILPRIDIEKCFAVVRYIDELVESEIQDKLLGTNGIVEYTSLNSQYLDMVRIIPKNMGALWSEGSERVKKNANGKYCLLRNRRECDCSVLDKETLNYMIWDKYKIAQYPMKIYHLDGKHSIAKHFYGRKQIVFGIVPFTSTSIDNILDMGYKGRTFHVKGMYKAAEEELRNRYKDIYKRSHKGDIDFLIFPEMLMTSGIMGSIESDGKSVSPQVIVNGSIWKDYVNKTIITDGNGNEIFSYCKKEPYKYKKNGMEYKEHLDRTKNKDYAVLEINGIGRIGVCICKDLLNQEVKMFHKYIGTDILIVPAYTKSMDLQSSAEELAKDFNCTVVVANACSAFAEDDYEKKAIGFVTMPAKNQTNRAVIEEIYSRNECINGCGNKCMGTIVVIDFLKTQRYSNIISFKLSKGRF